MRDPAQGDVIKLWKAKRDESGTMAPDGQRSDEKAAPFRGDEGTASLQQTNKQSSMNTRKSYAV
jgi:hypothetical protein